MVKVDLFDELEILFAVDDYEEVMYPIIKKFLLYRRGKFVPVDRDDIYTLNRAFMLVGSTEWIK